MRNFLLILSIVLTGLSCKPDKDAFVIEGKIDGLNVPYVYLVHPEEAGGKLDTLEVKNGAFRIKGNIENANVYLIAFGEEFMPLEIFLEPGKFNITGSLKDFNSLKISGGKLQEAYNKYVELTSPFNDDFIAESKKLEAAKAEGNAEMTDSVANKLDEIKDRYYEVSYDYIENRPVDIFTAKMISEVLIAYPDIERLQPLVDQFDPYVKGSSYGQRIINTLAVMKKTSVGTEAPLFAMFDIEGNEKTLESMKGKYVLIDFWASWCKPCRDENPRLVSLYQKFKGPKFEILGVSIDQSKTKWKEAVEADKLVWTQVIDENSVANKEYGIISIPSNILIDPQGVIIAKNVFGKKLEAKLQEVL